MGKEHDTEVIDEWHAVLARGDGKPKTLYDFVVLGWESGDRVDRILEVAEGGGDLSVVHLLHGVVEVDVL